MTEPTIEGRKSRLVAVDKLLQFIDGCIHLFLMHTRMYPAHTFQLHKRLGRCMYLCDIYSVRQYTKQFCRSIRTLLLLDRVGSVRLVCGHLRWVIEIPSDFGRTFYYAIPPTESRSEMEISSLCANVLCDCFGAFERKSMHAPRPIFGETADLTWRLELEMKAAGRQPDFPTDFGSVPTPQPSFSSRLPLRSAAVGDTVVVSVSIDTPSSDD